MDKKGDFSGQETFKVSQRQSFIIFLFSEYEHWMQFVENVALQKISFVGLRAQSEIKLQGKKSTLHVCSQQQSIFHQVPP